MKKDTNKWKKVIYNRLRDNDDKKKLYHQLTIQSTILYFINELCCDWAFERIIHFLIHTTRYEMEIKNMHGDRSVGAIKPGQLEATK